MYLNDFSVRIPEGREDPGGYVALTHGQHYTLRLHNARSTRCDANIQIDGKHVGTWRLNPYQSIVLERPANDTGRFTFYRSGTPEARQAQLPSLSSHLGLIAVTFTPEVARLAGGRPLSATGSAPRWYDVTSGDVTFGATPSGDTMNVDASFAGTSRTYTASSTPTRKAAGGTGLSGHSEQVFGQAPAIEYDYLQQTVIHLRLTTDDDDSGPRPLTAFSSPIPPPV